MKVFKYIAIALFLLAATLTAAWWLLTPPPPAITVNYTDKLNAPALAIPEDQRAWPKLVDALVPLMPPPEQIRAIDISPAHLPEIDPAIADWLSQHQQHIADLRAVAAMDHLGHILSDVIDEHSHRYRAAGAPDYTWTQETPTPNPPTTNLLLPYLTPMHTAVRTLAWDTVAAINANDPDRAIANTRAIADLAQLLYHQPFILDAYVRCDFENIAADLIAAILTTSTLSLTTDQLITADMILTQAISTQHPIEDAFKADRYAFLDALQRVYSPGEDGVMTKQGWEYIQQVKGMLATLNSDGTVTTLMSESPPVLRLTQDSHSMVLQTYDSILTSSLQSFTKPLHTWPNDDSQYGVLKADPTWCSRNELLLLMSVPSVSDYAHERHLHLMHLEAVCTMIAIARYRREHDALPPNLAALLPAYLTAIPTDRFTGQPLVYTPIAATYALYSVGPDRTDNAAAALTKDSQPIDPASLRFITPDRAARAVEQNDDSLCPLGDIVYHAHQ